MLLSEPVLRSPYFGRPSILHTDASENSEGAVLEQEFEDVKHPVFFLITICFSSERNYAVVQRERERERERALQLYGQSRVSEFTWKVNHFKSKLKMPLCSGYRDQSCQTRGCYDRVFFCRNLYLLSSIIIRCTENPVADSLSKMSQDGVTEKLFDL